jgi:hypothetical protein
MKNTVKIKDMSWPLPDGDLEHTIRYSRDLSDIERLRAASILSAYAQMIRDPQKKRQMVIAEIRKALKERDTEGDVAI